MPAPWSLACRHRGYKGINQELPVLLRLQAFSCWHALPPSLAPSIFVTLLFRDVGLLYSPLDHLSVLQTPASSLTFLRHSSSSGPMLMPFGSSPLRTLPVPGESSQPRVLHRLSTALGWVILALTSLTQL